MKDLLSKVQKSELILAEIERIIKRQYPEHEITWLSPDAPDTVRIALRRPLLWACDDEPISPVSSARVEFEEVLFQRINGLEVEPHLLLGRSIRTNHVFLKLAKGRG